MNEKLRIVDWLEESRRHEARRESVQMLQLHREKVAHVKRPAMWRELLKCVRSQVNVQQALCGGHPPIKVLVDPGDQAFFIRKSDFPHVTVRCQFLDERIIELRFSYRLTDNADTAEWEDRLDFVVDELDRVQFQHKGEALIDANEACIIVLRPILDSRFRPPIE